MYSLFRPLLFTCDTERAHDISLCTLDIAYHSGALPLLTRHPRPLPTTAFGLNFPNPVGLAAGLDKNGTHIDALFALGFGFIEIGTTTPRPQPGNPKPRLFRLTQQQAVINRMGFNNLGVDALVRNVAGARQRNGPLGINIGKNKDTPNEQASNDYRYCLERVYALADYVTINLSSPNTAGLRALQEEQTLRRLIGELREAQETLAAKHGRHVPMLIKMAPDLSDSDIDAAARVLNEMSVDGVIATNTTVTRPLLRQHRLASETGGLSGAPLLGQSTLVLRRLRTHLPETIALIGVGGICCGADAVAKMAAGANLVQCYTGLIFKGPQLVGECVEAIRRRREASSSGRASTQ
ncbi:quinone-dependent dihydroorotate dehydrogenase [Xylella fastidiosa]|uniref:Dihydroorotate dehydrogenase (quinone) n=2 Tax=Xylella fastidiosa TaxID=2371 RepID=PYRD_XYLFA|nr:quinone-dependent dihydroorotate dehydrogenase [Xylella fastidiosa]Q9PAE7.2 RecName: Full=Dihydroorotate dehydrogenase (quinone); AltName: Full=DHOdehase; Short=DHOD; Short=DHODase; AltName: Full=Dihydroorotate oxidase [Xylella fastidiosa 9a5c]ALQ95606.1 dihydroorotate dehydrogenase [Xylella fastidiosa]ALQ97912.1 quinone-dependent dihydroorotate dehydrogenase [Xylella fastidiosa]ALR02793.1 dihydroorotate dehydrogenase [Xylella fastidiosa]ALR07453.1 quinone-dependent dihydroorotate dehydroge